MGAKRERERTSRGAEEQGGERESESERGSKKRDGSLRMAGATAYEGTARAPTPSVVESEQHGGGGNMAAGQSVSNRRAERSSYAESRSRRHGDGSVPLRSATLRPLSRWWTRNTRTP